MNAYNDLLEYLEDGEIPEYIVFGSWGWDGYSEPGCEYDEYDSEEDRAQNNPPVPYDKRGVVISFNDAIDLLDGWVWGLSTGQHEARYDHEFNSPYVVIDYSRIDITHRAPAGHLLH